MNRQRKGLIKSHMDLILVAPFICQAGDLSIDLEFHSAVNVSSSIFYILTNRLAKFNYGIAWTGRVTTKIWNKLIHTQFKTFKHTNMAEHTYGVSYASFCHFYKFSIPFLTISNDRRLQNHQCKYWILLSSHAWSFVFGEQGTCVRRRIRHILLKCIFSESASIAICPYVCITAYFPETMEVTPNVVKRLICLVGSLIN